jgi:hypothetical protein
MQVMAAHERRPLESCCERIDRNAIRSRGIFARPSAHPQARAGALSQSVAGDRAVDRIADRGPLPHLRE